MKPYIGIVHKDPESAYGITFPDAPGCFSAVDALDDVFSMAREALEGWTESMVDEGHHIPVTRDLSEIKSDPRWIAEFADAALIIAVEAPQTPLTRQAA